MMFRGLRSDRRAANVTHVAVVHETIAHTQGKPTNFLERVSAHCELSYSARSSASSRQAHPKASSVECFDPPGESVDVLDAFLANRATWRAASSAKGLRPVPGASRTRRAGDYFEVLHLDRDFAANVGPAPTCRQIQSRQHPGLELFPSFSA